MDAKETCKQINVITKELMRIGVSDEQNYSSVFADHKFDRVAYNGFSDISRVMKDISYIEAYNHLLDNKQYNVKLLDGGLVHLLYTYDKSGNMIKQRLCYYPSPSFESYQNEPELYEDDSVFYSDITSKSILPVPVRIDFDPDNCVDLLHPASHLTLGQYKNCRIPVVSPICPLTFVNFILGSFYNASGEIKKIKAKRFLFGKTITPQEILHLHFSMEM